VRVLCVAAHPDDEILGPGGTLLRHKAEGDEVTIALTFECREQSRIESVEAEQRMGIEYVRWDTDIDSLVATVEPYIVYTHWRGDLNAEHRYLHERVLVACRPGHSGVNEVYAFDTASSTEWGIEPFVPDYFVDIEEVIEPKVDALAAYASELRRLPHPRNLVAIKQRAGYWGQHAGLNYAEAFKTIFRVR
jgi:LmbE family N-acetylglucosaminyl deacetylase